MRPLVLASVLGLLGLAVFNTRDRHPPPPSSSPSASPREILSPPRPAPAPPSFPELVLADPDAAFAWFSAQPPAVQVALALGLPEADRASWLTAAFRRLAATDPSAALVSLPKESGRAAAWAGLVAGWTESDPAGLARHANGLADGPERDAAFDSALPAWNRRDPAAFALWLNGIRGEADYDRAVAVLVAGTDTLDRPHELALSWVEGMADGTLRREAALSVLRPWASSDPAAALDYVAKASWLEEATRTELAAALIPKPEPE